MRSFKLLLYSAVILAGILVSGYLAAQLFLPVTLEWDANGSAPEGYRLFRRFAGEVYDYGAPVYEGAEIRFVSECPAGMTCFWVVRAYKDENESGDSNEVSLTVPEGSLPEAPTGTTTLIKDGIMYLIADPVSDGSDKLSEGTDYFEVELDGTITRSDGQRNEATGKIRLHHDLSGISEGSHTVRVRGVNDLGEGPWSVPFSFGVSLPGAVSGIGLSAE
jgi:hypothetical protein